MRRFSFALETLLRFRENLEEKERNELSLRFFRLHRERQNLDDLKARYGDTLSDLVNKRAGNLDPREIDWSYLYLKRLEFEIETSLTRIGELEKEVEAQKQIVVEATKKTKILDTLKTRKKREYLLMSEKEEQKTVDEIVVTKYARKES